MSNEAVLEAPASEAAVTKPKIYEVVGLDRAREKFAKLAKRAKKLGVEAPSFEVVGQHTEYQECHTGEYGEVYTSWTKLSKDKAKELGHFVGRYTGAVRIVHHVILLGVPEVKLAGWTFIATLDHELGEDNTIVRSVPGAEALPTEYRHRGQVCDHCHQSRPRKNTFVCKHEDGRLIQVGSTCVSNFLGFEAAAALGCVDLFASAASSLEEDEAFRQRSPDKFDLTEYLAWVCKSIRESGWVSRKTAYESGKQATADIACTLILDHLKQR